MAIGATHNESVTTAVCTNHARREAIGICVECRARICSECVTKVDGINYCVSCYSVLADRGAQKQRKGNAASPPWARALSAAALLLVGGALMWGLLEVALPS